MNILNSSQFAWAYTFCQNMQLKLSKELKAILKIKLGIHTVNNQLITSIVISNSYTLKNDNKKCHLLKSIIDVIPAEVSWAEMCQRWQQVQQYKELNEYYVYAPHSNEFFVWQRFKGQLIPLPKQVSYISYLLNVRFEHYKDTLEVFTTTQQPFLNFKEQVVAFEEVQHQLKACQTALWEKQQLLEQVYQRLATFEKHYQTNSNSFANMQKSQRVAS